MQLRGKGDPVLYLSNPPGVTREQQQDVVQAVNQINSRYDALVNDPEIATRIAQYEMAFRMQTSVPELMDTAKEPQAMLELYGCKPGDGSFASNCLLARRLAERGVRFIQLYHKDWDHHGGVKHGVELKAKEIDRACAGLIRDLKQRGHAQGHADRLGRRVWPHADVARRRRPRPSQQGFHDLAGRRRHQGRPVLRRHRRVGLRRGRKRGQRA